jgi:tRNA U34 5-methylaminomethyl-2-thiouridine-forming methyltransferase MnmC
MNSNLNQLEKTNINGENSSGLLSIVKTNEGIHTLFNKNINAHYHSLFGSMQESIHVFINNGFCKAVTNHDTLSILDMGFGTGLNAILTYRENQVYQRNIHYTGIDIHPLPLSVTSRLNYFEYFGKPLQPVFEKIHEAPWYQWNKLDNFNLLKIETDILDHRFDDHYDLIYYDPFSPSHQSNLWEAELFHKMYEASNKGAMLVTSHVKGDVIKILESVGYSVEQVSGTTEKKEMIRAVK